MFCSNCGKEINDNSKFCQYCGARFSNEANNETVSNTQEIPKGCLYAIVIAIIFVFICFQSSDNNTEEQTPQISQEEKYEQEKKLMKLTNDFVLEGKRIGLIKKTDKQCDNDGCIYVFWINDNLYSQYGYEDRKGINDLCMQYGKLRGKGGITRGYYSGKFL